MRPTPHKSDLSKGTRIHRKAAREVHNAGWAHFGFYPKHAFIRKDQNGEL